MKLRRQMWDVVVMGGGAAGLSAALTMGRSQMRTLVVDAGSPSNLGSLQIAGLLGRAGASPAEYYESARTDLANHSSVVLKAGRVMDACRDTDGSFRLATDDGAVHESRRVLLATSMRYELPDVPGLAERWGHGVFHSPLSHSDDVRDKSLGVVAQSASGIAAAMDLLTWTRDVTLFTDGHTLGQSVRERLQRAGVRVESRTVAGLHGPGGAVQSGQVSDGSLIPVQGVLVTATLRQRTKLARGLGAAMRHLTHPVDADAIQMGRPGRPASRGCSPPGTRR